MPTDDGKLTASEAAAMYALVQAQAALRQQITQMAVAAATLPWTTFSGWFSSAEIGQLVASVLRIVQPLQRQAAQVTDAFLARQMSITLGRRVEPVGVIDVTRLRRALPEPGDARENPTAGSIDLADVGEGRDQSWFTGNFIPRDTPEIVDYSLPEDGRGWMNPMVVYGRPADTYRYLVSEQDVAPAVAVQRAVLRAQQIAEMDVALAIREQSRKAVVLNRAATGFRRILHPELSQSGLSCGLCVVAADRIYTKGELLPLHPGCNCEVAPIVNGVDPGLTLNDADLSRLYEAAGGTTSGRKLQNRVRVSITEHGELGPILVRSNHHFRDPSEVARSKAEQSESTRRRRSDQAAARRVRTVIDSSDPAEFMRRRIAALEESIAAMERLQAAGEDFADQIMQRRIDVERLRNTVQL
ncbi:MULTISPECIES: hypothetical protein [unclassified Micromonospora]|uniref:hypothetical protein n=1 Tax=unclassified Micromonospora TaxID=2617518 RepID=UPI00331C4F44